MDKRFRGEPYLQRLTTAVIGVDGDWVSLDSTILFAFAGGQQADRGTIGGHDVQASEALADGTIRYQLPAGHGLTPGVSVEQVVDWELRLRVMRVHTATHMAYAAISEQMGGARELIGSNVHAGKGRIDWALEGSVSPWVPAAAERVAALVGRDLWVQRLSADADPERWLWQIEGDDLDPDLWRMPCGGTHVARTGEIGRVKLKRKNIGKGKERVEVTLLD
jgi:Ser-tRNA(Ala) deacylase AlaX